MTLNDEVTKVKQISSKYAVLLERLGIQTVRDLLTHFPVKYNDTSKPVNISDLSEHLEGENVLIEVKVDDFKSAYLRSRKTLQQAKIHDVTGDIKVMWFNQPFLKDVMKPGKSFLLYGKPRLKGKRIEFYPTIYEEKLETREVVHLGRITPEYSLTEGVTKKWFRNRIKFLVDNINQIEIKNELKLANIFDVDIYELIKEIHFPHNSEKLQQAINILSVLELSNIQLLLEKRRRASKKFAPPVIKNTDVNLIKKFISSLPFILTEDQEKLVEALVKRISDGELINELIQGDVGSGKTIVAIIISLLIVKQGYQVILLAPTTILAKQHYETFKKFLKNHKIDIELVLSNIKDTKSADILIGTSAILARKKNLINNPGLIIVDEQHKFGVVQREELLKPFKDIINSKAYPHFINMSATPIPRTIAQAFFGDVSINLIKTKPKGRLPINTFLVSSKKREDSYEWIEEKMGKGDQVFWVCPLISESEKLDAIAAEKTYEELQTIFKGYKIALLHGRMKENEKLKTMNDFLNYKYDILVSTSVIEVGVDVPNATIMIIEGAERFGLAQLHQIRGRVGRSDKQSWCFLFYSNEINKDALARLKFLSQNHDGLKIAEYDLKSRGPGEIYGLKQSGIPNLKIARLDNLELIKKSREVAQKMYTQGIRNIELFS